MMLGHHIRVCYPVMHQNITPRIGASAQYKVCSFEVQKAENIQVGYFVVSIY